MFEVESNTGRRIVRVLYITTRATDDYDYIQSDVTLNDAETLPDIPINPAGRPFTPNEVSGPDWQLTNAGVDQQPADDETISDSPINPFNVYQSLIRCKWSTSWIYGDVWQCLSVI